MVMGVIKSSMEKMEIDIDEKVLKMFELIKKCGI